MIKKIKILKQKKEKMREGFRLWLMNATGGCEIQGGYVKGKKQDYGWPCGTCVIAVLDMLGLNPKKKEYKEHNNRVDRTNEVWRAILQMRDAKLK